jgi:hypothetical protein
MTYIRSSALLGLLLLSAGCTGAAKARLQLENKTGVAQAGLSGKSADGLHLESITLSSTHYFAMKLASVYLAQDVDPRSQNNVGSTSALWTSPHCTSADDCDPFDFARPTATVNADLNSQQLDVSAGTYRYVRMEFCYHGETPTQPNISWSGADMTTPHAFLEMECGVTSTEFSPVLDLQPGDSVAVALGYDLTGATSVGQPDPNNPGASALTADDGHGVGFDDCVVDDTGTVKTCFRVPTFSPEAIKNGSGPGDNVAATSSGNGGASDGGAD